jgi:hypothetical protein
MERRDPLTTNVIACKWRRTADGWRLWVKGRPDVAGGGKTYERAEEALIDAIWAAAPDLDTVIPAVPEYDPPLPASEFAERYLTPELYLVGGDEFVDLCSPPDVERGYAESLFEQGICPNCRRARGNRTDVRLQVSDMPARVDAGWVRRPFHGLPRVFSARFLALLTDEERSRLLFEPIDSSSRARRPFFELRGPADVSTVGVRGLEADGLECTECGRRSVRVVDPRLMQPDTWIDQFVCLQDLPQPLPPCFTVGSGDELNLCLTRARWDALRGHSNASGLTSKRLGVVQAECCERHPRIRNRREYCEVCDEWPEPRTVDGKKQIVFDRPVRMCSRDNFTWLAEAERLGHIRSSQATVEPMALWDLAKRAEPTERTEFISLRCPNCWRLGWIVLTQSELHLAWRHGYY